MGTVVAIALVTTSLVAPAAVQPASAGTSTLESQVFSKINSDRHHRGLPSFKRNFFMDAAVEKLASEFSKGHEHGYAIEGTYVGVDSVDYNEPAVRQQNCEGPATGATGSLLVLRYTFCLENTAYTSAWKNPSYNYAALAIVVKGSRAYSILLMAAYENPPAKTLHSSKPSISGFVGVASRLTAHRNSWSPTTGTTFTYTWLVDGEVVGTGTTYTPTADQLGKKVRLSVQGTKAGYWAPERLSTAYTIQPGKLTATTPVVTGLRYVGQTLTAASGPWSPAGTTLSYQWLRSGSPISGATDTTYLLTTADYGKKIDVRVTGSAPAYSSGSVRTHTSSSVKRPLLDSAPAPEITGTPEYKQVLGVVVGDWQPAPVTLKYQWRIGGTSVKGATKPTFTVPGSAVGKVITVTVTGSHSGYSSVSKTSEPTATVASIPFTVEGVASITGTPAVGKTLSAHRGIWSPSAAVTYRWYRDGVPISHATSSTYKVTSTSSGATLTVAVTAKLSGYTTTTVVSDGLAIP
jgi:hypothetical protein